VSQEVLPQLATVVKAFKALIVSEVSLNPGSLEIKLKLLHLQ
jgi:hypothetical protein